MTDLSNQTRQTAAVQVQIRRHGVPRQHDGLSPLQQQLLQHPAPVRIAAAPTGAGKSYAFQRAMLIGQRVFFIVPTRRLAQNLARGLIEDLVQHQGWSALAAEAKVQIWSSDATQELKNKGVQQIGPYRVRQISALDPTRSGGEMVIAIAETLSYLLLQRHPQAEHSDVGVFHLLNEFDHLVFDEFHTIEARGFGLAATLARVAASGETRAKVSFLSATPVEIRPVLERLGIAAEAISELDETLNDPALTSDRIIHGPVWLELVQANSLTQLLAANADSIQAEIRQGRQVVCIYNALIELQRQLPDLERLLSDWGLQPNRVLVVNSLDDSRQGTRIDSRFATGRQQDPAAYDLLIATASVEMGVTFNADLLFMEPGFSPLNFLQRYGRAARRDRPGRVIVRLDQQLLDKNSWLRQLLSWAELHQGQSVGIADLTQQLTLAVQQKFSHQQAQRPNRFGALPNRARYSAALYWNALLAHTSNQGLRGKRLKAMAPPELWQLRHLLQAVRQLQTDPLCQNTAGSWCLAFEQQARVLRDIERRVRVREGNGSLVWIGEHWLQRHTLLGSHPILIAEDGEAEIRLADGDSLGSSIRAQSQYIQATKRVMFPTSSTPAQLPDTPDLPHQWCKELEQSDEVLILGELYPQAIQAAKELTRLTGLVVTDDSDYIDTTGNGIL